MFAHKMHDIKVPACGLQLEYASWSMHGPMPLREATKVPASRLQHLVVDACVEHARDKPSADALDLVATRLAAAQHGRLCRLHRNYLSMNNTEQVLMESAGMMHEA
jgi:hypothetical protein